MATPKLLIRIAAGCMLFFATGHSIGHVTRHEDPDPKAREVLQIMADTKFDMFGQLRSFDDIYAGMSLNLSLTLVAFAVILWTISGFVAGSKHLTVKLLIPITLTVFGFSITGFLYFFPLPAITCLVAGLLTTIALVKLNSKTA